MAEQELDPNLNPEDPNAQQGGDGAPGAVTGEQDPALGAGGEDGGGADEDRPLSEDEREIVREHRRNERHAAKERRRAAVQRKDRYITQLEQQLQHQSRRLEALEGRSSNTEMARLDAEIDRAAQDVEIAKSAMGEARKAGAVDIEIEAQEAWYASRRKLEELSTIKNRVIEGHRQRRAAGTPANQPNPQVVGLARNWMAQNGWYQPTGDDPDTAVVRSIDRQLTRENWDPSTKEYWDELTERVREKLPGRFGRRVNGQRQITGGASGESHVGGNGFRLSAERIEAMKEAGMWEDPKQRARMLKRYQDADRAAAERARQA